MNKHDISEREVVAWDRVAAEPKRHGVAPREHRAKYEETPQTSRVSTSVCVEIRTLAMAFSRTRPSVATFQARPENDLPRPRHLQRSGGDLSSIFLSSERKIELSMIGAV